MRLVSECGGHGASLHEVSYFKVFPVFSLGMFNSTTLKILLSNAYCACSVYSKDPESVRTKMPSENRAKLPEDHSDNGVPDII